jgi:hypothetical protein
MKKFTILIIIGFVFISCNNKDYRKFTVVDFSKKRIDTLIPYKNKTYVSFVIKVKGYTNDTVKIKRIGFFDIKLSGQLDTIINYDYYGSHNIKCVFDPYKATEGKLKIEYSL